MPINDELAYGFQQIISRAGKQIRLRYFTQTLGSIYDDDVTLTISGNDIYTSGIVLPINSKEGTFENLMVEQGKLNPWDQRLYTHGSLLFNSGALNVKIGLGSPASNTDQYSIIPLGGITAETNATQIYKKVYIRRLPLGSLQGE